MRLLIDAHCFDYQTSEGVNTYLRGLYSELVKIAINIDFYFVANDVSKIREIFGEAYNVHYIPLASKNKMYRLLIELPRVIKEYNIDIAHYQYVAPLRGGCRTIVTLHDVLFLDFPHLFPLKYRLFKGGLFWLSAKRADLLLTVSEYSKERIIKHFKIPLDKIFVTPNAVSEDFWHIDEEIARHFVKGKGVRRFLLYVSRIEPRKNQLALLRAYTNLKLWENGYDLVYIGRKTLPSLEFDKYYDALPELIKSHIYIYNQVSYQELKFWYKAASLFVYPALAEGFGIPPIEAGAAGVPCICSNKTAMGDFTFFRDNLLDISDEQQLEAAIQVNLLSEEVISLEQISDSIYEKYNWNRVAKSFQDILSKTR